MAVSGATQQRSPIDGIWARQGNIDGGYITSKFFLYLMSMEIATDGGYVSVG